MLLLVDGYNLLYQTDLAGRGRGPAWLERARERLLAKLAAGLDPALAAETLVVFDAAGALPGAPARSRHAGIEVRFAVEFPEADDLLERLIAQHPLPRRLTVVSSDHRLQRAARRRRASFFDSEGWYGHLLDGRPQLGIRWPPQRGASVGDKPDAEVMTEHQLAEWLRLFEVEPPARRSRPHGAARPPGGNAPAPAPAEPRRGERKPRGAATQAKAEERAPRPQRKSNAGRDEALRRRAGRTLSGPLENPFPENYIDGMEEMP